MVHRYLERRLWSMHKFSATEPVGICFAAAWQAIALITTATKRSLRVFVQSGFTRIHFRLSTAKST